MQRILRDQARKFDLDWREEPQLRVQPGESFEIETWDASSGFFRSEADKAIPGNRPGFDRVPPMANPLGGPGFIKGAERGERRSLLWTAAALCRLRAASLLAPTSRRRIPFFHQPNSLRRETCASSAGAEKL